MPGIVEKHADRIADVSPLLQKGIRVLEIGCADGSFGSIVKKQQTLHYSGIEPSPDAVQASLLLDEVFRQPASQINTQPFDLLLSFHVLEHIADITTEIDCWKKLLKPKGQLLIEVPNRAGHPWLKNDRHPEHLHLFTEASLLLLLTNSGLQVTRLSTGHFESTMYSDSLRVIAHLPLTENEKARQIRKRISELLPEPFVILGLGGDFRNYIEPLLPNLAVAALCDTNPNRHGERIGTYTVTDYDPIHLRGKSVLVASLRYGKEIRRQLRDLGVPETAIVGIDEIYA